MPVPPGGGGGGGGGRYADCQFACPSLNDTIDTGRDRGIECRHPIDGPSLERETALSGTPPGCAEGTASDAPSDAEAVVFMLPRCDD
jgi:hypothetical protein